jgi:hypothetical protein
MEMCAPMGILRTEMLQQLNRMSLQGMMLAKKCVIHSLCVNFPAVVGAQKHTNVRTVKWMMEIQS